MRTRAITVPLLLLAAIGVAGCGSSSNSGSSSTATPAGTSGPPVPSRTYTVKLTGSAEVPKGAPAGGGMATISIRGAKQQVCWTFHLRGVSPPSVAHIHTGAAGVAGPVFIPLGAPYTAKGCMSAVPKPDLTLIEASPKKYYVNVHNAKYPNGVVRAQL